MIPDITIPLVLRYARPNKRYRIKEILLYLFSARSAELLVWLGNLRPRLVQYGRIRPRSELRSLSRKRMRVSRTGAIDRTM